MILSVEHMSITFGDKKLLDDVSMSASDSQVIAIVGRNGAGKSTFMRSLIGLQSVASGTVKVDGVDTSSISISQRSKLFSYVSTVAIDIPYLTVWDVVAMGRINTCRWDGSLSDSDRQIVKDALSAVSALDMSERYVSTLSDGERQRVMIARAVSQSTPIIMLDEPTAFLDVPNRLLIHSLLRSLSDQTGKLVLFSTHEIELARKFVDFFWLVENNSIHSFGVQDFKLPEDFRI